MVRHLYEQHGITTSNFKINPIFLDIYSISVSKLRHIGLKSFMINKADTTQILCEMVAVDGLTLNQVTSSEVSLRA